MLVTQGGRWGTKAIAAQKEKAARKLQLKQQQVCSKCESYDVSMD